MLQKLTASMASWYTPKTQDMMLIIGFIALNYLIYRFAPLYFFGLILPIIGIVVLTITIVGVATNSNTQQFRNVMSLPTNLALRQLINGVKNNTLTLSQLQWLLEPGILRQKVKINYKNCKNLIHKLCQYERKDLLEVLLPHVTNPKLFTEKPFGSELNACHVAVEKNNIEIIKLLCKRYAELSPTDNLLKSMAESSASFRFITPLDYAAELQLESLYRECLGLTSLDEESKYKSIYWAVAHGSIKRLEFYEKVWGQDVLDWDDKKLNTLFGLARAEKHTAIIDYLINKACQKGWLSSADEYKKAVEELGNKEFLITRLFNLHRETKGGNNAFSQASDELIPKSSASTSNAP